MTTEECAALQTFCKELGIPRERIFLSTTQTNNNDWHCTINPISHKEMQEIGQLVKRGYRGAKKLHWTTSRPTEPGWYAFKYPMRFNDPDALETTMVKVVEYEGDMVYEEQDDDRTLVALSECDPKGQWKGPLDLEAL